MAKKRIRLVTFICTNNSCLAMQKAVKDAKPKCYQHSARGVEMRRLSAKETAARKDQSQGPGLQCR